MEKVYLLGHSYDVAYEGNMYTETKTIGIYSTREKAEEVAERYQHIQGFNKYPASCFVIDTYDLDKDHWTEGFMTWEEIEGYQAENGI